jgi:hypothetical protein
MSAFHWRERPEPVKPKPRRPTRMTRMELNLFRLLRHYEKKECKK